MSEIDLWGSRFMALFSDIEFVSLQQAESPDAFAVVFDVIYAGETWCRSLVTVERTVAARLEWDEKAVVGAARDALLELLGVEAAPVSFHLRLTAEGCAVLARATPGR
ncbi:MAG: hypothetical protein ACPLRM_09585 [Anaerolineae bacterium]